MNSRKTATIVIIFVMSLQIATAQNKFGIKAGLILSDLKYGFEDPSINPFEPEIFTGMSAGFEISWPLGTKLRLNTGIEYSRKGKKNYLKNPGANRQKDLIIDYISFPITLELPIWKRLTIRGGIEANYLIKISHNLIYDLKLFDYGPRLELGWTQQNLRFAVAGYHGARPFFGFPLSEPNFDVAMKNLQFSVAYIIREKTE